MKRKANAVRVYGIPLYREPVDLGEKPSGWAQAYVCHRCKTLRVFGLVPLVYALTRARIHATRCGIVEETVIEDRDVVHGPGVLVHREQTIAKLYTFTPKLPDNRDGRE